MRVWDLELAAPNGQPVRDNRQSSSENKFKLVNTEPEKIVAGGLVARGISRRRKVVAEWWPREERGERGESKPPKLTLESQDVLIPEVNSYLIEEGCTHVQGPALVSSKPCLNSLKMHSHSQDFSHSTLSSRFEDSIYLGSAL